MRAVLIGCATLLILSACQSSGPKTLETTRPTITLRYESNNDRARVQRQAVDYCDRYNLEPRLVDTGRQGDSRVALYECR